MYIEKEPLNKFEETTIEFQEKHFETSANLAPI